MKKLDDHHKKVMKEEREKLKDRNSSFNTDTEEDMYTQTTMTRDMHRLNIEDLEDQVVTRGSSVQFESTGYSPKRLLSAQGTTGKQLNIRTVGFKDHAQQGSDS